MRDPISHKLAPFLKDLDSDFQGPVANYATLSPSASKPLNMITKIQTSVFPTNINDAELVQLALQQEFDILLDIFCVDKQPNSALIYRFENSRFQEHLEVVLSMEENSYSVPSLSPYYDSALWLERECFDLFGVYFEGHPDLKRIILYPEFAGHPLLKNYPIHKAQPLVPVYV